MQEVIVDTQWLERLRSLMALGERATVVLAAVLLAAVVLILDNTIRLAIEGRRDQVVIATKFGFLVDEEAKEVTNRVLPARARPPTPRRG